jgi:hypothetical protein
MADTFSRWVKEVEGEDWEEGRAPALRTLPRPVRQHVLNVHAAMGRLEGAVTRRLAAIREEGEAGGS